MWNFVFFATRQITGACLFVCFFFLFFLCMFIYLFFSFSFSHGSSYRPSGPRMSQEGSFWCKWKVLVPFLSDQIIGGHLGPLTRSFFPNSTDQNFEIAIFFRIVENHNNFFRGILLVWGLGWGEGAMWEDLSLEEYVMWKEKLNEKGAGLSSITIKKKTMKK